MELKKLKSKFIHQLQTLRRDILLLWKTPREYLYSFTYPTDKYIHIKPYDPEVKHKGEELINKIHALYPALKVNFIGSSVLGISGQKDIDLIIESPPEDFHLYIKGLTSILGKPVKKRVGLIEWDTRIDNYIIDVLMMDHKNPIGRNTIRTHERIKKNKMFLKQYEKLKLSCNGTSLREYKRRRLEFFNYVDGR